jgi:hypothetical protein
MKTFTPTRIIYPASAHTNDILIAGEDENGIPTNITITDEKLAARLTETPEMIVNPDRAPLEKTVFQQTLAKLNEDAKAAGVAEVSRGVVNG